MLVRIQPYSQTFFKDIHYNDKFLSCSPIEPLSRILIVRDAEYLRCYMYVRSNFLEGGVISNFAKLK